MSNVPNPALGAVAHFPYGHPWSCGATFGHETSTEPAAVTCDVCLTEMTAFPERMAGADHIGRDDPETGEALPVGVEGHSIPTGRRRPDSLRGRLSARILAALDERRWADVLDAAQHLYAHELEEDASIGEAMQLLRSIERRLRDVPRLVDEAYRRGVADATGSGETR